MFSGRMRIALFFSVVAATVSVDGFSLSSCAPDRFSCDEGKTCLPQRWLCDGDPDCRDGADESAEVCDKKPAKNCTSSEFRCDNARCLPASWQCDGQDDCGDASDEVDCSRCTAEEYRCGDGQCITKRWRCNGFRDCSDGSDEVNCTTTGDDNAPATTANYHYCWDGHRVPLSYKCDGDRDCVDGSDEEGCPTDTAKTEEDSLKLCQVSEFRCSSNGYCIRQSWVCDGSADCEDGQDEQNCPNKTCSEAQFRCGSGECVPLHQRCNGFVDCRDKSDEIDCEAVVTVTPPAEECNSTTHFQCQAGPCIPKEKLCNDRNDCGNSQDESETMCGVNECERKNGGCDHICVDTKEGHECTCRKGYKLAGKYSCEDIDECKEMPGSCSQVCVNTRGSFHCSCQPGYLRDPANYTRCKAAVGEAYLLFSHSYDIRSLRLRDRDMTSLVSDTHGATALDYHYGQNKILWSDRKQKKIFRADMSNTEDREVLVTDEEVSADGLAVDWIHSLIFYTDTKEFSVKLLSWDHKWSKTLVTEDVGHPRAIVVSPITGHIYWTDWGKEPKIERAGLDGAHRQAIVTDPHVAWPNGVTIDHSTDRIYWCDGRLNKISSARLDGSDIKGILFSPSVLRLPYSISVFEDRLYWTDWSQLALYSANKFNGEDVHNVSAGYMLESPKVVHVFHQYRQPAGENVCAGHSCSHICVRSPEGDPLCTCPDLFYIASDGLNCVEGTAPPSSSPKPVVSIDIHEEVEIHSRTPSPSSSGVLTPTSSNIATVVEQPSSQVAVGGGVESAAASPTSSHLGLTLGLVLGSIVGLVIGAVVFMVYQRTRTPRIKRFRFNNPVYRKTTDDDIGDERGFTIAQEQLFYNPTREFNSSESTLAMTEADDEPLTPEDGDNSEV